MKVKLLSPEEFRAAEDKRMELGRSRSADIAWKNANKATYGWASMYEITGPCVMWYTPWFFDPNDPGDAPRREEALKAIKAGKFHKNHYLSRFYWEQWSKKRPPLNVLTPNGKEWCVDAVSSNGEGWTVTGDPPNITCSPSILVPGYHGYLRDGEFTPNM